MANNYGAFSELPKKPTASAKKKSVGSKSVRPKNVNKNIKVSQSEIDSIKKLGMKKALQIAALNKGSEQKGAVGSFNEGVRRLYGETRYQNAVYTPKASPGIMSSPRATERSASKSKPTPKAAERAKPKAKSNTMTPRQVAQKELSASRAAKFSDPVNKRFPGRF